MFKKLLVLLSFSLLLLLLGVPAITGASSSIISDGFDFPLGKPEGVGYGVEGYGGLCFLECKYDYQKDGIPEFHPGEDWNDDNSGNDFGSDRDDKGDPIYAVSNGIIKFASYSSANWGNVVLLEHTLPNGEKYWSQYAHMVSIPDNINKKIGTIVRRGDIIGFVGDYPHGYNIAHHLHFEIRKKYRPAEAFVMNWTEPQVREYYVDPSDFINSHRPIPKATLTVSETTDTTTKLSWTKPDVKNFSKYEIYRSAEAGGTGDASKRTLVSTISSADTLEFTDTGLSSSTNYFYSVFVCDNTGNFSQSDEVSAATQTGVKNISQNPYSQRFPRISGKYVVWNDGRIINGNITTYLYVYDIEKAEIKEYGGGLAGSKNVSMPSIYGSKVFYEGKGSFPNSSATNLYIIDIETYGGAGSGFMVDNTSYNYTAYPEIYKNIVVWQEYKSATIQDIYYLDLENGGQGPVPIAEDPGAQLAPAIWERKIVYIDAATTNKKIVLADIDTKEKTMLFEGSLPSSLSIDQGIVSWVQNSTMYYYDIDAKVTKTLANTKASSAITKEKKLIYYGYAGAVGTPSAIHIYDIVTGKDSEAVTGLYWNPDFDFSNGVLVYTAPGDNELASSFMDIFMVRVAW